MRTLLIIPFLLQGGAMVGQWPSLDPIGAEYDWPPPPALDASIPPLAATEGADILLEEQRVTFHRAKAAYISIVFEQHLVLRFDDRDAIERFGKFQIPASHDPQIDQVDVPWEERETRVRPLYFNTRLDLFAARILGPPDRTHDCIPEGTIQIEQKKLGVRLHDAWSWKISLRDIAPGDTVEVRYKYMVPYEDNWWNFNAVRHFFHGPLYKHRYSLLVEAHDMQGFRLGGAPQDSSFTTGRMNSYLWRLKDLPGCTDEVNARPWMDLPYITYATRQDMDQYLHRQSLSGQLTPIPYWAMILRKREQNAHWMRRVALKRLPDAQNKKVHAFIDRSGGDPHEQPVQRAMELNNVIATQFNYRSDDDWFAGKDGSLEKLGDQLDEGIVREISRYNLYAKLFSTLGLKYYTTYLLDKRVGALEPEFLTNLVENEWMFLLNDEGVPHYLHPRNGRIGLLTDEIPFYWQGTRALVGDVDELWEDHSLTPELVHLPILDPRWNTRNVQMDIEVVKGSVRVEGTIVLSGAFSTLMRPVFQYGIRDSTVHPMYGQLPYELDDASDLMVDLGEVQRSIPYRFPVRFTMRSNDRIEYQGDSVLLLDLSGLVKHMIPAEVVTIGRDLPFYWDFQQLDKIHITLSMDQRYNVVPMEKRSGDVAMGAVLEQKIEQLAPGKVQITSELHVDRERVNVHDMPGLEEICKADQALLSSPLKFMVGGTSGP